MVVNLNGILSQVRLLNDAERTILLKKISLMAKKEKKKIEHVQLSQLSGLGHSVWSGVDIDKYVEEERKW